MFSIVIWSALAFGSICLYVRSISFMFLGKIPYLIKKSHIRRFDSTISSIANLENVASLDFLLMILILGSLKNNSSLVATLATVSNPFYRQNSKMAAK